jgi:putative ABC transport system permease protein
MKNWFFYFLKRSIKQRLLRFALSASAVMLTVLVVTALVTITVGIRTKMAAQLRSYGANMMVTDRQGGFIAPDVVERIGALSPAIRDATPQVYGAVPSPYGTVEIVGVDPRTMTEYRITGAPPRSDDEVMVGGNVKDALRAAPGGRLVLGEPLREFRVTALFERGTDDDGTVVLSLSAAQRLLGVTGVSAVLLRGDSGSLAAIEEAVLAAYPALRARTLRQVAVAEERILGKIQLLMLAVTAVILLSSAVALGSTMAANVLERSTEIGLLKAIGATRQDIRNFFLAEATLAGLCGAGAGYFAGIAAAEAVSRTAFGSYIVPDLLTPVLALVLGVAVALIATYVPVRDAMRVVPALILRGE